MDATAAGRTIYIGNPTRKNEIEKPGGMGHNQRPALNDDESSKSKVESGWSGTEAIWIYTFAANQTNPSINPSIAINKQNKNKLKCQQTASQKKMAFREC